MSFNRTLIRLWIAEVILHNGQTLEIEVRGKTISQCREELKRDTQIKQIVKIKKAPN